jgi:hypothetical protein
MINECYILLVNGSDEKSFPDVQEKAIIEAEEESPTKTIRRSRTDWIQK